MTQSPALRHCDALMRRSENTHRDIHTRTHKQSAGIATELELDFGENNDLQWLYRFAMSTRTEEGRGKKNKKTNPKLISSIWTVSSERPRAVNKLRARSTMSRTQTRRNPPPSAKATTYQKEVCLIKTVCRQRHMHPRFIIRLGIATDRGGKANAATPL